MKNAQRGSQRKTAAARAQDYADLDDPAKPKFIKWLRGKFGMTVAERFGGKPIETKVGAPYQRVQHRPQAQTRRG